MSRPTRRQFTHNAAVAAVSPFLVGPPVREDDPAKGKEPTDDPVEAGADALLGLVVARYGKHLDEGQRKRVRRSLANGLVTGNRLKSVKLSNADEPDCHTTFELP